MNVETMIKSIPVTEIHRDHKNSRQFIDPKALEQLQADIRENGLINPITVVPRQEGGFCLIAGERRYLAYVNLGYETVAAHILESAGEEEIEAIHLAENLQREDLSPIDEAETFERQLAEKSIQDLAAMINRSEEYIRRRMKLLHLIPEVRQKVRRGAIGLAVSELLSCLPDERQKTMLATVEEQSLNAVQLSNLLTHQNDRRLINAVFDTKDCLQCPHNSAGQPDLFAREASGLGRCLYDPCWSEKELERAKSLAKQIEEMGPRAVIAGKIRIGLDDLPPEIDQTRAVMHNKAELGEESLRDCQSCKFLVVFISSEGHPLRQNICTNRPCYDERAARFRGGNAEKKKSGSKKSGTGNAKDNKTEKKSSTSPVPIKMTPANAPQRVKDFKRNKYQEYLAAHFPETPENRLRLIILAMKDTSWGRSWTGDATLKELNLACDGFDSNPGKLYPRLRVLNAEQLMTAAGRMALKALDKFSLPLIEEMVFTDLGATPETLFQIDRAYLELLTKAEIEATAKEIGLTDYLQNKGESISKLVARPKKEFIDSLLSCGFTAQGMPAWLQRETGFQNG
ncbi:MAG: ParB/RepB/Spo0J family partition protein [Candidatus Manganitrophaceae bacterium]|nr:MAG: ParB/RepB/Spo0J family partition protein [Candidatus Manganitrophaceae bacterium]